MSNEQLAQILGHLAELQNLCGMMAGTVAEIARGPRAAGSPSAPVVPDQGNQVERMLAVFRQATGEITRTQLKRMFPRLNDNSLSGVLQRLKDRGQIEAAGRGRYRLRRPTRR